VVGRFDFDLVQFWWAVKEIWSDQVLPCQLKNNEGFRLFCVFFKPNYVVLVLGISLRLHLASTPWDLFVR
jgi:hypothetical protein